LIYHLKTVELSINSSSGHRPPFLRPSFVKPFTVKLCGQC
jgi:hypothetical protein